MKWKITFTLLFCYLEIIVTFNPFVDNDLHSIDWAGPITSDLVGDDIIVMQTSSHEKYKCVLPKSLDQDEDMRKKTYNGPTPKELMDSLFAQSSCSYRIESYWTYELCHGKHMRQYHENKELSNKKPKIQEYFLGLVKNKQDEKSESEEEKTSSKPDDETKSIPESIKIRKIDGIELPYYEVNMTDGTACDLTNAPRKCRIYYVCQPDGRGEIYEFKETSTCEYEIVVLTAVLCTNPFFKPKNPPVSKISCHAVDGAPIKPSALEQWTKEDKKHIPSEPVPLTDSEQKRIFGDSEKKGEKKEEDIKIKETKQKEPDTTLKDITDKSVLRGFLSGSQCLYGGSGWWNHEVCFNKHAIQYHEDANGRTEIILGKWNEAKHIDWIKNTPSKKTQQTKTSLNLLYTDGDVCDLTGKKRKVEVRLQCVKNPNQPHSVTIYLVEPRTCEYILGVESPLFCGILNRADEYGVIRDINV